MGHGAEVEIPHEEHDPFIRMVAFSVAIFAVILAFTSFGGHNVSKEMMLLKADETLESNKSRQEEFNIWTQFQSKSTREALYRNEKIQLAAEKEFAPAAFPAFKDKLLTQYTGEEQRMKVEKDDLAAKAKQIKEDGESKVKEIQDKLHKFQQKDHYFDFAEVALQLAIVLASVTMLSKKRWAFIMSLALVAVGLLFTLNGYTLAIHIGFMEGH